jgi:hypothetical protein
VSFGQALHTTKLQRQRSTARLRITHAGIKPIV